jgi:hypothetical protein
MSRTPSSAGNRKTWTLSCWVKRTELTANSNSAGNQHMILSAGDTYIQFDGNAIWVNFRSASENFFLATNRLFRDIAAWYHIVLVCDTTESTASNRAKLYINGVQETSLQNSTYDNMSQNYDTGINNSVEHEVGKYTLHETTYANFFCGYIAEMHLVDGTALAPTDFGEFDEDSGIWKPINASPTYGTNGFKLEFKDSSSLGTDTSGNGHTWSLTNIAAADQATDTPTNNFATSNFLISQGGYFVTTEGGTKCVLGTAGPGNNIGGVSALSTIAVSKGKWYMEMKNDVASDSVDTYCRFGFVDVGDLADGGVDGQMIAKPGSAAGAYFGGTGGGRYHYNNTAQGNSTTWIRQVMGMALDLDNRKAYFHIDGTYTNSGDPANGTDNGGQYDMNTGGDGIYVDETWVLGASAYNLGIFLMNWGGYTVMPISSPQSDANGYGTFEYAPPSGYYALCSKNLAEYG